MSSLGYIRGMQGGASSMMIALRCLPGIPGQPTHANNYDPNGPELPPRSWDSTVDNGAGCIVLNTSMQCLVDPDPAN
jgi:hypothetical protein